MAHIHSIYDTDPHFTIDPDTRKILNQSTTKTTLMQGDHNSERFTFEMPRKIDEHDMAQCSRVEIHYLNVSTNAAESNGDVYLVDDLGTSPNDENVVIFSWLVSGNATQLAGSLSFRIRFICLTGEVVDYAWHTSIFENLSIGKGMSNSAAVVEKYSDVLEKWKTEIIDSMDEKFGAIEETLNNIIEMQNKLMGGASE